MNGLQPDINIKSTGDYQSSLAEIILTRYIKIQNLEFLVVCRLKYLKLKKLIHLHI